MKILLLSDTHGDLACINRLAAETGAEAVIHAGDFGFYDDQSALRLPSREIRLRVRHSGLPVETKKQAKDLVGDPLREWAHENVSLSDLPDYLKGREGFQVPVFAVWGNHEDKHVVNSFRNGEYAIENLHIVDEERDHWLGPIHVYGLGGNIIPGPKLFEEPLAGERGQIWSTLSQLEKLRQTAGKGPRPGEVRLLVSHVSPGKEPLIWRLAAHTRADLAISGHMDPPLCSVWNEFTVRDEADSLRAIDANRELIEQAWQDVLAASEGATRGPDDRSEENKRTRTEPLSPRTMKLAEMGLKMVRELPQDRVAGGRRGSVARWTRRPYCVNLPDAPRGHALIEFVDGSLSLKTFSAMTLP